MRALQDDASVLARFWTHVDTTDSESGCWEWRGHLRHQEFPTLFIGNHSIAAARVAWFTATGELPSGGRLHHVCENLQCVRPEHLAWAVSRRTVRDVRALCDGYLTTPGVPVEERERVACRPRVLRYVAAPRPCAA